MASIGCVYMTTASMHQQQSFVLLLLLLLLTAAASHALSSVAVYCRAKVNTARQSLCRLPALRNRWQRRRHYNDR
jgi:hypothetical protein